MKFTTSPEKDLMMRSLAPKYSNALCSIATVEFDA
jgi:hypothetical protein